MEIKVKQQQNPAEIAIYISSDIHDMKVHQLFVDIYLEFSCHIMYTVVCMIISHSNLHKIIIKSIKDIK